MDLNSHSHINLCIALPLMAMEYFDLLTNDKFSFLGEVVCWNLQVQWCRTFPHTPRDVVVRSVAGTEPTTVVTGLTNGDTTQMCADTKHDEPFGLLHTVAVWLRVTQRLPFGIFCFFDLAFGTMTDEDWLATPFDDDLSIQSTCQYGVVE